MSHIETSMPHTTNDVENPKEIPESTVAQNFFGHLLRDNPNAL